MSRVKPQESPLLILPKASIKRILYVSTLSPESFEALNFAILLARSYSAKLFCFHAIEEGSSRRQKQNPVIESVFSKAIATYLGPTDNPTLDWEMLVDYGDAANTIVGTAAKENIDLIVMLSRRRPLGAAILGSTAEAVCKAAPCSVLVVHPKEPDWTNKESGKVEISRIIVGCDFSEYSKLAFSFALEFANTYGSEIDLLQVLPPGIESSWLPGLGNPIHQSMKRLENFIPQNVKHLIVNRFVGKGEPYQEILNHASGRKSNLICIGAHGKESKREYLFGATTDKILRSAPCPILVARFF